MKEMTEATKEMKEASKKIFGELGIHVIVFAVGCGFYLFGHTLIRIDHILLQIYIPGFVMDIITFFGIMFAFSGVVLFFLGFFAIKEDLQSLYSETKYWFRMRKIQST